ncbi:uncharacterized protein LOC114646798 [Erpetoichthys calabaricus]|uniref:G protein-regulated inducer of neurite outgrowth C-terminal domain-containing protein n=1 Tax=Erpetoichthys calabaricus TaxID=27687 RepID=A0A8C4X917_ERPCA|nr:uncharacterized protein LOC114646798 [Erpetoichthys calabaricus]XP_051779300.1 uncharacterized protein LOC114646798 [Erpetoichthys calabaricus]XP_051779301.1 uncharacterized protein LOC114646798 [Erpetoichthys calabaricus]
MAANNRRLSANLASEGLACSSGSCHKMDQAFFPLSKSYSDTLRGPMGVVELEQKCQDIQKSLSNGVCHQQREVRSNQQGSSESITVPISLCPASTMEKKVICSPSLEAINSTTLNMSPHLRADQVSTSAQINNTELSSSDRCQETRWLETSKPPVQRSHSDSLYSSKERQMVCPGCSMTFPNMGICNWDAIGCATQGHQIGSCRRSPINSVPLEQPQALGLCVPNVLCNQKTGIHRGDGSHVQTSMLCAETYHTHSEGTFPAFCHSLPIPAPVQLLSRVVSSGDACGKQSSSMPCCPAHAQSLSGIMTFPRLVSSVSETGLDVKRVMTCLIPGTEMKENAGIECLQQKGTGHRGTRDAGTMTSLKELTLQFRDMAVQTSESSTPCSPLTDRTPHVYPEINLVQEPVVQKSPVKEVKWDEEGMTWEVYGASVDPEVLGHAIQKHLELQIEEATNRASALSQQNKHSTHKKARGRKGLKNLLINPACCTRTNTAID